MRELPPPAGAVQVNGNASPFRIVRFVPANASGSMPATSSENPGMVAPALCTLIAAPGENGGYGSLTDAE